MPLYEERIAQDFQNFKAQRIRPQKYFNIMETTEILEILIYSILIFSTERFQFVT